MTLKEVSARTGLSISFLSQVERGNSSLAITSLQKIAEVYQVPITYFFEEQEPRQYYVPAAERKPLRMEGTAAEYVLLGGNFAGRALEPFHVTLPPGMKQEVAFNHPGEEFFYVLTGEVIITVDGQTYHLQQGDAVHFPSTLDHVWHNPGNEPAQIISVLTPVIFHHRGG